MIDNWLDCILWLGMLFIFLYAWLFDGKVRDGITDFPRIEDKLEQTTISAKEGC
jgi:hypothetical protein